MIEEAFKEDNIAVGTYSFHRRTARCSKYSQYFHKSCEKIPEDAFDNEEAVVLLDMYVIRSRIVPNTFSKLFSRGFPQICNILARTVLVIKVANKRFQKNL